MTFFELYIERPCVTRVAAKARQLSLLVLLVMAGMCTSATPQSGVVYLPRMSEETLVSFAGPDSWPGKLDALSVFDVKQGNIAGGSW
jgi:hypothetical protein